jgi:S-DNA-T family DNA segregation ATPase FtsK/SpoIIIE
VRASFDDAAGMAVYDALLRVYADGPETGINVAVTASRVGGVPAALASATVNKVGFRLGDANDYSMLGLRRDQYPTSLVPGRAVLAGTGREIHVALPGSTFEAAVSDVIAAGLRPTVAPTTVDALPTEVPLERVVALSRVESERWLLGVGISDATLAPAGLVLYENEHATVAGPARSGKSSTLLALGSSLRAAQPDAVVVGIARRRSPMRGHPLLDTVAVSDEDIAAVLDAAMVASKPTLVLIDDADGLDDPNGRINQLLLAGLPHVRVAIAGRPELLRSLYGHWTQVVRRSKAGVLLQPNLDLDGELLGATLPRRLHVAMQTGRGFVVADGHGELVQLAH